MGFDLKAAEKILCDLAKFHGTTLALKHKKPDIFENKIKPHCTPFNFIKGSPVKDVVLAQKSLIQTFPDCAHVAKKASIFIERDTPSGRGHFAGIAHFDVWVNNIMNKSKMVKLLKTSLSISKFTVTDPL